MTISRLTPPSSPMSYEQENRTMDNDTLDASDCFWHFEEDIKLAILGSFLCFVCVFGLVGNGAVIWLLGFHLKSTPVTTYILNLAVADFGVLLFVIPQTAMLFLQNACYGIFLLLLGVCMLLFYISFSTSQFLLTIISVDRCVSVLFPIWYRCHRPEKLSNVLCAIIWIFCFLVHGIGNALIILMGADQSKFFLMNAMVCLPLITISTLILFIRFCLKSQQHQRGKLLLAILLALIFFLFLASPLNIIFILFTYAADGHFLITNHIITVGHLCASLNSSVNPLIYFLVGRKKKVMCTENLRVIFQRIFKQDEVYGEELQPSTQNQVLP